MFFFLSFVLFFFFAYLACSVKGQCRAPSDARQTADVKFFQCHLGGAADPNGHALSFRYGTKVKVMPEQRDSQKRDRVVLIQ